jgi:hypothetical protein
VVDDDERKVSLVTERSRRPNKVDGIDQRRLTFDDGMRLGYAVMATKCLSAFASMAAAGGAYESNPEPVEEGAYRLEWRLEPTPRIQIWIREPHLYQLVSGMLASLEYEVRSKGDHLVAIIASKPALH